jgi:hypothetical protein
MEEVIRLGALFCIIIQIIPGSYQNKDTSRMPQIGYRFIILLSILF